MPNKVDVISSNLTPNSNLTPPSYADMSKKKIYLFILFLIEKKIKKIVAYMVEDSRGPPKAVPTLHKQNQQTKQTHCV
jgi:hypothetical protein